MYTQGFEAEIWFRAVMKQLKMLDVNPPKSTDIRRILVKHLRAKSAKAIRHLKNVDDGEEWLDLALKVDTLLRLEDKNGQLIRVGVDVTSNPEQVDYKLGLIESYPFRQARKELDIAKHWVVLVNPNYLPEKDRIVDVFYTQVDRVNSTAIIEF